MAPARPRLPHLDPLDDKENSQHLQSSEATNLNPYRREVETLYCEERWTLTRIMKFMQEKYSITASRKQFKDKINSWGLGKNLRESDVAPLVLAFHRADRDPGRPQVKLRGHTIKRSQVNAYLKRKEKSEQDILATEDVNQVLPHHIKYFYPRNLSLDIHPNGQHLDMSPSTLTPPSCTATYAGAFSNQSTGQSTPASSLDVPPEPAPWSLIDTIESYNSVIDQILGPDSSAGPEPSQPSQLNFFKMLSGARRVSDPGELARGLDGQFRLSMNAMKDVDGQQPCPDLAQRFLGCFFSGCMLHRQGASEGATNCFRQANKIITGMIKSFHPECLSALNGLLPVLEAHGQNQLAGEFLSNVVVFLEPMTNNPVAATAEFMIRVATRRSKHLAVEVKHLEDIHEHLKHRFGAESPSALVGLYHVAWSCAKEEELRERALQILTELVPLTSRIMGRSHFLTITSMATRARVLSYVGTKEESISLVRQTIRVINQRYAHFHPYRLEVLYRLARLLIDTHQAKDAEKILRGVIERRVVVLGPDSNLTERSVELLQEAIQATGRHVELVELKSELLSPSRVSETFLNTPSTAFLPLP